MGLVIQNLLALQEVDVQIISLNDKKTKLLDSIEQKKSEVEQRRGELEEREQQLKRIKVEMKSSEVELAQTVDRIRKLESQQILVKTNQEYKALDKEIYEAKAHQAQTEELLLEKMEFLEEETGAIREARQQLDLQGSEIERESTATNKKIRELDDRMAKLQAKRSEIAATIDGSHLSLYDRIFDNKKGRALVPVVNRSCQGCHLAVPAAVESILRRHASDIIICENCARILYVAEEKEPEEEDAG
jgi:predicted  nucleic acid-binding Zn-ribbon protein